MLASMKRATLAILAGVIASPFAAIVPAAAQDTEITVRGTPEGTNMRMVSYADLNLNLMAHREVLNKRIGHAVREVCEFEPRDIARKDYERCSNTAWAGAGPQIVRAYVRASRLAYGYRR